MRAAHDSLVIDRDVDEELIERNVLLGKGANQIAMLQTCNRQHRRVVHLCVVEAVQKMNASRTGSGNTHAEPAGELRVGAGHKSGGLFMPHMNESYPLLLLAESLEDSIDAIARQTEYGVNAPGEQAFYEYVRCVTHLCLRNRMVPSWLDTRLDARFGHRGLIPEQTK